MYKYIQNQETIEKPKAPRSTIKHHSESLLYKIDRNKIKIHKKKNQHNRL